MRFEILIQFIVPLTFLAIWALTTLLNRDAQPLPPRPGRMPNPRPGGQVTGVAPQRPGPVDPAARGGARPGPQDPLTDWGRYPSTSLPPRRPPVERPPSSMGDAIVYLESETGAPPTGPGGLSRPAASAGVRPGRRGSSARKSGRPRSADGTGGGGRAEGQPQRALSDQMQESMALKRAKPLEITPLGSPMKRLTRPLTQASASAQVAQDRGAAPDASLSAMDARKLLEHPERLREAVILSEILQRPVALRRRR